MQYNNSLINSSQSTPQIFLKTNTFQNHSKEKEIWKNSNYLPNNKTTIKKINKPTKYRNKQNLKFHSSANPSHQPKKFRQKAAAPSQCF